MLSSSDSVVQYTIITTPAATYTIPFKYWGVSEIKAKLSFADSADETLDYTSDFTVSDAGGTGTLTRVGTWTADAIRLTIYRELPYLQETDYRNGDGIDAEAVEKSVDRLTALSQQIAEQGSRQVTVPITDPAASLELPSASDRANKLLAFDASGNAYPGVDATVYTAADVLVKLLTVDTDTAGINATTVKSVTPSATGLLALAAAVDTIVTGLKAAKAGDADTVAATIPSTVGKAMLSAANKAAQQALVSGSGLDADTVSGYGIGTDAKAMSGSLDNYTTGGLYFDPSSITNSPWGATYASMVQVMRYNTNYVVQIATAVVVADTPLQKIRVRYGTAWDAWRDIWNAFSDGNGGQQPAPKPKAFSSNTFGEWINIDAGTGNNYATPNVAGSVWAGFIWAKVSATGAYSRSLGFSGVAANTEVLAAVAGESIIGFVWRTA